MCQHHTHFKMNKIKNINHTKYWMGCTEVLNGMQKDWNCGNMKCHRHIKKQFGRPQETNVSENVEKRALTHC